MALVLNAFTTKVNLANPRRVSPIGCVQRHVCLCLLALRPEMKCPLIGISVLNCDLVWLALIMCQYMIRETSIQKDFFKRKGIGVAFVFAVFIIMFVFRPL